MKYKLLLFVFVFLQIDNSYSQLSKKHFIPPLTYAEEGNANPENHYFYISTPSLKDVSYTIKQIGSPNNDITGIISRNNPRELFIANGNSQLFVDSRQTSIVHNNKGYIVEATDVVYVSIRALAGGGAQAGALVSKGSSALGTTFRAGMFTNENPQSNYLNFISVMASEDNTQVTFDDLPTGISIKNYTGTLPISVILNEGESYVVATNAAENTINRDGLIGTLINSDKPVIVNTGAANGSFHNGGGRDYGIDQIVGLDKVGTDYIFVKGDGENGWENVLIVAHEDGTEVEINNNGATTTINKAEYLLIEGNEFDTNGNMFVKTSNPVFAYQGVGASTSEANQGMFFVPPLSCESRGKVDNIPIIESIGNVTFTGGVTVVTNANANVSINSEPIANFSTSGPYSIDINNDGIPDYETYKVTNLTGNVSVESSDELYCAYFNVNGAATSGSFYSGFPTAPEINFDTTITSLGNCIPNITLQAANTDLFDSFEWQYFNESTLTWEFRSFDSNYKPIESEPGRYKLIGAVVCTGATFESIEVPVSICPDDYDGDLIIDNLDVDLDNDGILNCDESLGNAKIDLTNINNPNVLFPNGDIKDIITSTYTANNTSNTFTGNNAGVFVSTLNPSLNTSESYKLDFAQKTNLIIRQANEGTHTPVDGEFFTLNVFPNNKNITLLNPDNTLLIDTNFDGEYESGITSISASEIRFKYNVPNSGTASSIEFFANQIEGISFTHSVTGTSEVSTFRGNFLVSCFARDSDNDGVEDSLDLDSDNDGIPDVHEAFPQPSSLSGVDANLDGLDDIFDGILNVDSDNDGILNYLDLDSDNDGIFDSTEAGHNLDTDFDGIVDNANSLVGINGLVDNLESTPNAKLLSLNYTIANTDNDTDFDFVELDADNDNCFDVTEAGFTDANNDGILDASTFAVNDNGKVINNLDGYTSPNLDYITSAPIVLNTPFEDVTFCENEINTITIDTTADTFQWEFSSDGTTWITISDDIIYNGSTTNSLQINNTPINYHNNQYRVILKRSGNACTETSNAITLNVNPLPILKANPELNQCIEVTNTNTTVNLTLAQQNVSETPNVTFEFYEDMAGTNLITNPTNYPIQVNIPERVFVKVISEFNCESELTELTINVGQTVRNTYDELQPPVCDDFLDAQGNDTDANSDTDNITNFSLDKDAIINSINPPMNTEVFFYENESDRNNSLNEIDITNFRNDITKNDVTNIPNGIQFPIYYKILSTINNDCQGLGQFYLQINAVPSASQVPDLELCDDGIDGDNANGIVQNFDLDSQTLAILNGQNPDDFTVTYHDSAANANTGTLPLTSPYANTTRDLQTIFVRVTNNSTGCFTDHTSFNLIVNPVPIANFVKDLEVCDDNADGSARNGFSQSIDLDSQTSGILGSQDSGINTVTYHRSFAEAQNGSNPLVSPYSNQTPNRETIYIRIENTDTGCVNSISNFDVIVNPEPTFVVPTNLAYCDDALDGDDSNGIIQNIDLDSKIPEILGNSQSPNDFNVTFHKLQADASSGDNAVTSPYQNTDPTERFFVRIQNKQTLCINDNASFEVIVNPLPDFEVTTPQTLCLNDLPLNIAVENPRDVYTYQWIAPNGNPINTTSVEYIDITVPGKYTVTATTTNGTLCERTETIEIKESNIATLAQSFITIIDESNNIGSQDLISIFIDTINNDLGPGDYQFAIFNQDDNERIPMIGFQDEPLFENLTGGIYTIIVNDKNGCEPDTTLEVSVIQFPKFFTPNGDGNHDTWIVKGVNKTFYPNSSINIFNRYGKLVAQVPIDSQGWNGIYQGNLLPADDYWFNITLIPPENSNKPIINKKGNFSLLRK
ncbi:T9SS type B sorting domain-containing protein [Polaribacter sp. R77954]|uniref:T9SS type B sorting domain-containing protein n=1 Tax=Polaribacter sp. R77954 TaxID=3093870 RepID=UPI0037C7CDB5